MNSKAIFDAGNFLTDGGLETTLIYGQGVQLNHFAAFELLRTEEGRAHLEQYYLPYFALANRLGLPFVVETPTWRASREWAGKLGYASDTLSELNKKAVTFVRQLADEHLRVTAVISGNVGPRGDGYQVGYAMTASEAADYHSEQIRTFSLADADIITAMTLNYSDEAIGVAASSRSFNIPVVISFTVETDGRLPSGESLQYAIEKTDEVTSGYVTHYMINCAHPRHFANVLSGNGRWKTRIRGIRANASQLSHEQLDASETLDRGDIGMLVSGYGQLKNLLPDLRIVGGCCGTDHEHVEAICARVFGDRSA